MKRTSNDDTSLSIIMSLINTKVLEVATSTWNHCLEYAKNNVTKQSSSSSSSSSPQTTMTADMTAEVNSRQSVAFDRDMQVFEEEFSKKVSSLIEERVNYVIEDLKIRAIIPFLDQSLPHITEAYNLAISEFMRQLSKTIYEHLEVTSNDGNISGLDAAFLLAVELDKVETSIDFYAPEYISKSQEKLWSWYTECLAGFADMFESSDNVFLLYCGILDSVRDLIRNALFTFKAYVTFESDKSERKAYLTHHMMEVLGKLRNDCKTVCMHELLNLINHLIEITVQESIVAPCADQVNHTESLSGNFKALVDMELYTERNILRVVHDRVARTLSTYTEKLMGDMDNAYIKLLSENKKNTIGLDKIK